MDDGFCLQTVSARKLGLADPAAAECGALDPELRAGCAMDGAVYAAAAEKRFICGVDDAFAFRQGDVAVVNPNSSKWSLQGRARGNVGNSVAAEMLSQLHQDFSKMVFALASFQINAPVQILSVVALL